MADWQIDRDWRRLAMVPEAISSRQCSADPPIQGQSNANRDPVLDWRFLVNPRKSRSILCNANTNSVPIGAQTNSSSIANPRPIGANPLPIHCQSCANPLPIRCQSDVSQLSRSFANRVIIWCQSFANRVPIEYQSSTNRVPTQYKSIKWLLMVIISSHHQSTTKRFSYFAERNQSGEAAMPRSK